MGFADLILATDTSQEEKILYGEAVRRNGQALLRLIDDILDVSKVEAGRMALELRYFDINELIGDIRSVSNRRADDADVNLIFKREHSCLGQYVSDPIRIKQILLNIIGNAIKFSAGGEVIVEFSTSPLAERNSVLFAIDVSDDGIGLSEEQAAKLFNPFVQADSTTRRLFGGSGLGLMISRKIARVLDGDVLLSASSLGRGSKFRIELPLKSTLPERSFSPAKTFEINENGTPTSPVGDLQGRSILVVDDTPDNVTLVDRYLRGSGLNVSFASNGLEALAAVAGQRFELVIMDIQMPQMDGHEATRELRKRNFAGPIIALTAHALKEEQIRCRESGCDEVLTKPGSRKDLLSAIRRILAEPR